MLRVAARCERAVGRRGGRGAPFAHAALVPPEPLPLGHQRAVLAPGVAGRHLAAVGAHLGRVDEVDNRNPDVDQRAEVKINQKGERGRERGKEWLGDICEKFFVV